MLLQGPVVEAMGRASAARRLARGGVPHATRVRVLEELSAAHGAAAASDLEAVLHAATAGDPAAYRAAIASTRAMATDEPVAAMARAALEENLAALTRGTSVGEHLAHAHAEARARHALLHEAMHAETSASKSLRAARRRIGGRFVPRCPRCHVQDPAAIEVADVQTRAGDEAARQKHTCKRCGFTWLR